MAGTHFASEKDGDTLALEYCRGLGSTEDEVACSASSEEAEETF
jgi:hypothetical protein